MSLTKISFLQAGPREERLYRLLPSGENAKGTSSADKQLGVRVESLETSRAKEKEVVPHTHTFLLSISSYIYFSYHSNLGLSRDSA